VWHDIAAALGLIAHKAELVAVEPYANKIEIKATSLDQTVANLSGGNQQKVSVAKWLIAKTRVLIIDEPTVGVDVRTKGYLHQLIWNLADNGVAILLISSELSEMTELADRVYVMNDYRIIAELANERDYDRMSAAIMHAIQEANERQSAKEPAAVIA
jgi:ribose transport system ATP-binding protein